MNTARRALGMSLMLLVCVVGERPALAVDCGDAVGNPAVTVKCSCGDQVVSTRHLSASDPVVQSGPCAGDGLVITANNVVLDMNTQQITGTGVGVGIRVEPNLSGVKIRDGRIVGFDVGVSTQAVSGAVFSSLRILHNAGTGLHVDGSGCQIGYPGQSLNPLLLQYNGGTAVEIVGDSNAIGQAALRDNGGGISVVGDDNVVFQNRLERNGGVGIIASGAGNSVTRNTISLGDGDGIQILGTGAEVSLNQVKLGDGLGIDLDGIGHNVTRNIVQSNAGDGVLVTATGSRFDRNQTKANGGFGIEDKSVGTGTSGTANTYTLNTCSGDAKGKSSPGGLCR